MVCVPPNSVSPHWHTDTLTHHDVYIFSTHKPETHSLLHILFIKQVLPFPDELSHSFMMKVQDGIESTFLVPIKMSLSRALATKLYFFLLGAPFPSVATLLVFLTAFFPILPPIVVLVPWFFWATMGDMGGNMGGEMGDMGDMGEGKGAGAAWNVVYVVALAALPLAFLPQVRSMLYEEEGRNNNH